MVDAPRRRKVAIVGFAPGSRPEAPYDDPEWEIWTLNNAYVWADNNQIHRWFDIHDEFILTWDLRRGPDHLERLAGFAATGKPVYLWDADPRIPGSVRFPAEDVMAVAGAYLTSSISWMLGLALLEGFEHIGVWGVDMSTHSEYADQRPGCEYLIGYLRGKGIRVDIPESCGLLKGHVYSRGRDRADGTHLTHDQFKRRLNALMQKESELAKKEQEIEFYLHQLDGSAREVRFWMQLNQIPSPRVADRLAEIDKKAGQVMKDLQAVRQQRAIAQGSLMETRHWITITPDGPTAEALAARYAVPVAAGESLP